MKFWVRKRLSVEAAFLGEIDTLDKKIVERRFLGKGLPDKKAL